MAKTKAKLKQVSKNRQRLLSITRELTANLNNLLKAKVLTKGTICNKIRKCGNPNCRCAWGKLHTTKILSFSHKGRSKIVHLSKYPVLELAQLEKQVKEYQKFRLIRARIVNYLKALMAEINIFEQNLLEEVIPTKGAKE